MAIEALSKVGGLMAALVFLAGSLPGQTLGTILGTVTDDTGAVIPGVQVTIASEEQGTSVEVGTQGDGTYYLPNIRPGTYSIRMESEGFRSHVAPAKPSASAQRKKATRQTKDGKPLHSFRTLLADLNTIMRNACTTKGADSARQNEFDLDTLPNAEQQRALELLEAISP